jgi:hypothetical protein
VARWSRLACIASHPRAGLESLPHSPELQIPSGSPKSSRPGFSTPFHRAPSPPQADAAARPAWRRAIKAPNHNQLHLRPPQDLLLATNFSQGRRPEAPSLLLLHQRTSDDYDSSSEFLYFPCCFFFYSKFKIDIDLKLLLFFILHASCCASSPTN